MSLKKYIAEAEHRQHHPDVGDAFAIELEDGTLLETYILAIKENSILLDATDKIVSVLNEWHYIGDCAGEVLLENSYKPEEQHSVSDDSDDVEIADQDSGEYDYEGDMAKDELATMIRAARRLTGMLDDNENMPEWVQKKISKAADYVDTAADYIESNKTQGMSEGASAFMPGIENTPEYKKGFATGALPVPYPEGSQQYINYYKGVMDKVDPKGVAEGGVMKSIKRSMAGWGAFDKDKPKDVVNKVKGQDTDVLKRLHEPNTKKGKGSPAELQQKAISRELKKRGDQGVAEGMLDNPGKEDSPVAQAIIRRILMQRTDLLAKYGPVYVGQAVDDVADSVGDVDEIGSSDVSGWIKQVEWNLKNKINQYDQPMDEAKYQGREVPLGKPMRGDVAKFKVYVRDPSTGNIKKVNFGHGGTSAKRAGQKTMRIKKSDPARRRSFRARHNCDNPGSRLKARYWSCRAW